MMPTEQDLRAALVIREELTPEAGQVLDGLPARVRRRRARSVAAFVAVTVAVAGAIGVPMVLSGSRTAPPTPPLLGATTDTHAADRPLFSLTLAAGVVGSYDIRPTGVFTTPPVQIATVLDARGGQGVADLEVFASPSDNEEITGPDSVWPFPTTGPRETSTQVNGVPAVFSLADGPSSVRWEYAPHAWARVRTAHGHDPLDERTLLAIAADVRFIDPYPMRAPFRLDYLPSDLRPYRLGVDAHKALVSFYGNAGRGLDLTVTDTTPVLPDDQTVQWTATTIGGLPARCSGSTGEGPQCELTFGDVTVLVGASLTTAERDQVVAGLHLATIGDPSTWFDVATAIPGA